MIAPHLYDYQYWFSTRPLPLSIRGASLLLFIFVGMIVADIVLRIVVKKNRKVWDALTKRIISRVCTLLETMSFFGFLLLLLSYEGIPVLGGRYFLLLWVTIAVVWAGVIAREAYVVNPEKRAEATKKGEFSKYFKK